MGDHDKVTGKIDELHGKARQQVGKTLGDRPMQRKGKIDETKGDLKQAKEKIKDAFR